MAKPKKLECGLIMPISAIDGCSGEHWQEVRTILTESISSIADVSFNVKMVSESEDVGVIQKRIVQNVYSADMVVCDVSGKNPNVMFELGMRLAFDKPTVIVMDDKTNYTFDIGIIEHQSYPRDLRFGAIVEFKETLAKKVCATHNKAVADPSHSTFLKNFGSFQVANLSEEVVSADQVVLNTLSEIQTDLGQMKRRMATLQRPVVQRSPRTAARTSVRHAVKEWILRHGAAVSELSPSDGLFDFVEERLGDPGDYFDSRDELEHMVASEVARLSA